ncbi:MAG: hypothetical protein ACQEQ2_04615 [Pseudomonadota bacterium]
MARQVIAILILTLIYSVTLDAVLVAKIIASDADFLNEVMREPSFLMYFSAIFLGPVIEEFVFRGPVLLAIKEHAKKVYPVDYRDCFDVCVCLFTQWDC